MIEHQDRQQRSGAENGHLSGSDAARDPASLERPERIRQPITHQTSSPNGSNPSSGGGATLGAGGWSPSDRASGRRRSAGRGPTASGAAGIGGSSTGDG